MQSKKIKERNEEVKQWLWRYRDAKKEVKRLEEELQELIELQKNCGAIRYSDMPKGGGSQSDLSDYVVKQEEIWKKIHKARYKRIVVFDEIRNVINRLPNVNEREVMTHRYLRQYDWSLVAVKSGVELRQAYRLHGKALAYISKFLPGKQKCH